MKVRVYFKIDNTKIEKKQPVTLTDVKSIHAVTDDYIIATYADVYHFKFKEINYIKIL